jgi:hypothetical protein
VKRSVSRRSYAPSRSNRNRRGRRRRRRRKMMMMIIMRKKNICGVESF